MLVIKVLDTKSICIEGVEIKASKGEVQIAYAHGIFDARNSFRLTKIEVYEGCRNKGYGTIIIQTLIGVAKANKCQYFVFEGVKKSNCDAIRLYKRLGAIQQEIMNCTDKEEYVINF